MAPYACAHFRLSHMFAAPRGAPSLAAALLAGVAALLWLLPAPAAAHGFLAEPASRNLKRNWQYCPHCVNFGGAWPSSGEGRLAWPRTAQPACGARDLMRAGEPVATYSEGEVIDISVFITAHHGGRHSFRLCTDPDAQERCFNQHVLERADWDGPYSWTKTTGGSAPGAEVSKGTLSGQGGERYTWRYRLPTGVSCNRCVLQWVWTTANSCRVPGTPSWVGSDSGMLPCTNRNSHPEEFRNCADISIKQRNRKVESDRDAEKADEDEDAKPSTTAAKKAATRTSPKRPAPSPKPAASPQPPATSPQPVAPAPEPAGDSGTDAVGNATVQQQQLQQPDTQEQQAPLAGEGTLNNTLPAPQQAAQLHSWAAAADDGAEDEDACQQLGSGLHTLPLPCPKFLFCANGKGWVLYCPKGKVWDTASQTCVVGQCEAAPTL